MVVSEAEKHTKIRQPKVSKWGAALKDTKKYRTKQLSKAYQAALARAEVTQHNNLPTAEGSQL